MIWRFPIRHLGTPSYHPFISIYGFSLRNHPFWDSSIVGNLHIYIYTHLTYEYNMVIMWF